MPSEMIPKPWYSIVALRLTRPSRPCWIPFWNLMTATRGDGVVTSTGTWRMVPHGMAMLRPYMRHVATQTRRKGGLQDGDEQRIPELLGLGQTTARTGPSALGVDALGEADEDPDENDREPTSETMVAFEEAAVEHELETY